MWRNLILTIMKIFWGWVWPLCHPPCSYADARRAIESFHYRRAMKESSARFPRICVRVAVFGWDETPLPTGENSSMKLPMRSMVERKGCDGGSDKGWNFHSERVGDRRACSGEKPNRARSKVYKRLWPVRFSHNLPVTTIRWKRWKEHRRAATNPRKCSLKLRQ